MNIHTVTDLNHHIKELFDADPLLTDVWVEGEVSNFRPAASGHWYWSLRDDEASLRCVMWKYRAAAQDHIPEDGGALLVHGAVSVYVTGGQYQLYVDHLEPVGLGDLYREFEVLKARLEAEGLFDQDRKREPPRYPERIGVVTSPDAAALRDVCKVLTRRWPNVDVLIAPTLVQGEAAPPRIAAALEAIGRAGVDVVIITRGGGSIEDLWAFNDEDVARAIAACPVPVISGVGHETDVTIADFAADVRAPTPSAAAELATPDGRELALLVDDLRERLTRRVDDRVVVHRGGVAQLARRLELASPARRIETERRDVTGHTDRLARALGTRLRVARADLGGLSQRLHALSPRATLTRGYSHIHRKRDGTTVRSTADVRAGDGLAVRVSDGTIDAVVEGQQSLFAMEKTS